MGKREIEDHDDVEVLNNEDDLHDDDLDEGLEDDPDEDEDDLDDPDGEDEDEDDSDDSDGEDDDEGEDDPSERRQKPRTARQRIAELARARRKAEEEAFKAEMRAIELERRLSGGAGPDAEPVELPKKPNPDDFTYGQVDPDFIKASIDYGVALKEAELRKQFEEKSGERTDADRAKHYQQRAEEVYESGEKKFPGKFRKIVSSVTFDPEVARLVLDSDHAVDIAFHLCKNLDELRALTRASSTDRARKIGQIEGRFSALPAEKRRRTSAPEAPGTRRRRTPSESDSRYGPSDLDAFEKAFYGR